MMYISLAIISESRHAISTFDSFTASSLARIAGDQFLNSLQINMTMDKNKKKATSENTHFTSHTSDQNIMKIAFSSNTDKMSL